MYYVGKIYNWQINQSVNGMELLPDDLLWELLGWSDDQDAAIDP